MNEEDRNQYQKYRDKLETAYIAYIVGLERELADAKNSGFQSTGKHKLEERKNTVVEIDNKLGDIITKHCVPPWKTQDEWVKYLQQSDQQVPSTP